MEAEGEGLRSGDHPGLRMTMGVVNQVCREVALRSENPPGKVIIK